jgi:poly-beta-1,6-N-acetyl-D-glucosamine synthase
MLGWIAVSWDDPDLRFEHLRPMGSSQTSIWTGKRRHGFGQWFMGSDPLFYLATCIFRMAEPPYVLGGLAMLQGYADGLGKGRAAARRSRAARLHPRLPAPGAEVGKARAVAEIEAAAPAGPTPRPRPVPAPR